MLAATLILFVATAAAAIASLFTERAGLFWVGSQWRQRHQQPPISGRDDISGLLRSEAGRTGGASRRVQADPDEPPRHAYLRAPADVGEQPVEHPLGDTPQR